MAVPAAPMVGPAEKSSRAREIAHRALAGQLEIDRRQPGQVHQACSDTAGGFLMRQLQGQPVRLGHVVEIDGKPPRSVEALGREGEIEPLGRVAELGGALRRQPGCGAEDRLAEGQFLQCKAVDDHPDRQFGQDRFVGDRCRLVGRQRAAQDLKPVDGELVHLEAAAQQRRAAPDQAGAVEIEPDAVLVRDADIADDGVRGQGSLDAADGDLRGRRREKTRDQACQDALVALRLARAAGHQPEGDERGRGDQGQEGEGANCLDHQKACPIPT